MASNLTHKLLQDLRFS